MSLKHCLTQSIHSIITYLNWKLFENREKNLLSLNSLPNKKADGEDEYLEYWKPVFKLGTPMAYRLYSEYCGKTKFLVSENCASKIDLVLNPSRYIGYYQDKNNFDKIVGLKNMPGTILRIIDCEFVDRDYNSVNSISEELFESLIENEGNLILKQSVDSDSGRSVMLFHKTGNGHYYKGSVKLTLEFFKESGKNVILQRAIEQHPDISIFNNSSVNTLRIVTYKSVTTNEVHILSTVIRIGANGSEIDNMHAGGRMVRVDMNGKLAKTAFDQYGRRYSEHNGIRFDSEEYTIPNFDKAIELAKKIAEEVRPLRLIQHDISIDRNGNPVCIEFNVRGFPCWVAQFTGTPAFGEFTDEIRNYVMSQPEPKYKLNV